MLSFVLKAYQPPILLCLSLSGSWELIPAIVRKEAGNILHRPDAGLTQRDRQPFPLTSTPVGNLESPVSACPGSKGSFDRTTVALVCVSKLGVGSSCCGKRRVAYMWMLRWKWSFQWECKYTVMSGRLCWMCIASRGVCNVIITAGWDLAAYFKVIAEFTPAVSGVETRQ